MLPMKTARLGWLAACLLLPMAPASSAEGSAAVLGAWKGKAFGFLQGQRPYFTLLVEEKDGRLQCWMGNDTEPPRSRPASCALKGSTLQLTTWNLSTVTLARAGDRLRGSAETASGLSYLIEFQR